MTALTEPVVLTIDQAEAQTRDQLAVLQTLVDEGAQLPLVAEPHGSALRKALQAAQLMITREQEPRPVGWKLSSRMASERLDYSSRLIDRLAQAITDAKAAIPAPPALPEEAQTLAEQERRLDAQLRDAYRHVDEPGMAGFKAKRLVEQLEAEIHDCRALRGDVQRAQRQQALPELRARRDAAQQRRDALEQRIEALVAELAELTNYRYRAVEPIPGAPTIEHAAQAARGAGGAEAPAGEVVKQ